MIAVVIYCDVDGCDATANPTFSGYSDARGVIDGKYELPTGWTHVSVNRFIEDRCPVHS